MTQNFNSCSLGIRLMLLLPFALGQPLQVNQVLIRSILVIVEPDTSTRIMFSKYHNDLIISKILNTWNLDTINGASLNPIIGDSLNGTAVEKIVVDKRLFRNLQFRREFIHWSYNKVAKRFNKFSRPWTWIYRQYCIGHQHGLVSSIHLVCKFVLPVLNLKISKH